MGCDIQPNAVSSAREVQRTATAPRPPRLSLYLLGYYNLRDELSAAEAAELQAFLERWRPVELCELRVDSLLLIRTHDDLALDSRVVATLTAPRPEVPISDR